MDDAVSLTENGVGAIIAKMDIMHALRLIPVRPADWHFLKYTCKDQYCFDDLLPIGSRASPYLFCQFPEASRWIIGPEPGHPDILVYCDDFLIVPPPLSLVRASTVNTMTKVCRLLGVPLAVDKTEGPTTKLTFSGIYRGSVSQTSALPQAKFDENLDLLAKWHNKKACKVTRLQSLVGKLQLAAECLHAGRLPVRRMIKLLSGDSNSTAH